MLPGQNTDEWTTTLRSGLWRLPWQLSAEGRRRYYAELMPLLHDTKRDVLGPRDDESYYLVYLGTKPSGRGRGYARMLIEGMAARVCFFFLVWFGLVASCFLSFLIISCVVLGLGLGVRVR